MDLNTCRALCKSAFKENIKPAFYLQSFALLLLLSYYFLPATKFIWNGVSELKKEYGLFFIALVPVICGGFIPLLILLYKRKIKRDQIFSNILFCVFFWSYRGTEINFLYDFFAYLFGDSTQPMVIIKKVLCDQFIYSFLWSGPTAAVLFKWKANKFIWATTLKDLNMKFFKEEMAATIFAIWLVWIQAVNIIYILPLELQYVMFNIVLCFFSLILSSIQKDS